MSINIVLNSSQPNPRQDRVLVHARADEAPPPRLLGLLRELDLTPVVTHADDGFKPSSDSLRCAIFVGTARDAAAADRRQLDAELEWVRATDRVGTPILGIGHGARALACALGGGLERVERGQRGWALVDTSVPHFIAGGPWITWQREAIRLPPGAELLAHNRLGPQAFKVGRHLAVQFHPEATPDAAAAWTSSDPDPLGYHETLTATRRDPAAAHNCARRLLSAFLDSCSVAREVSHAVRDHAVVPSAGSLSGCRAH